MKCRYGAIILNSLESQDVIAFIFKQLCLGSQEPVSSLTAVMFLGGGPPHYSRSQG